MVKTSVSRLSVCRSEGDPSLRQKSLMQLEFNFDLKPVDPTQFILFRHQEPLPPKMTFWVKLKGAVGDSESDNIHRCIVAYISDSFLLTSALLPVAFRKLRPSVMLSLDHSIWFHEQFRTDDWMLYECESPRMSMSNTC